MKKHGIAKQAKGGKWDVYDFLIPVEMLINELHAIGKDNFVDAEDIFKISEHINEILETGEV